MIEYKDSLRQLAEQKAAEAQEATSAVKRVLDTPQRNKELIAQWPQWQNQDLAILQRPYIQDAMQETARILNETSGDATLVTSVPDLKGIKDISRRPVVTMTIAWGRHSRMVENRVVDYEYRVHAGIERGREGDGATLTFWSNNQIPLAELTKETFEAGLNAAVDKAHPQTTYPEPKKGIKRLIPFVK